MREIILRAEDCCDKESTHRYIAKEFGFPEWYGHNLDALHDCLTDIREDITVTIPDVEALEEKLGPYARRLIRVFVAASSENPHIHLTAD